MSDNTRRTAKNHLQIPSFNTKFGTRTSVYRASQVWGDLPTIIGHKELTKIQNISK